MPKYKPLETSNPDSIETSWNEAGEIGAVRAVIQKYARVLDMTDSGRDIKPLATGMFESIDRLKSLEAQMHDSNKDTPLFKVLKRASGE